VNDGDDPIAGPFQVFDLTARFALDVADLERRLLSLSREHHPDRAGPDPGVRAKATLRSAQIHEAYSILRDPERRAEWLLVNAGGPSAEKDKSVPEGFLEAMLDLRMEVEDARVQGGKAVETLESRFRGDLKRLRSEISSAMEDLDPDASSFQATATRARGFLNQLAYHKRLLADLRDEAH